MTNSEAHAVLEDLQRLLTNYRHISKELTEANGIAILAVEKQIQKKPTLYGDFEDGKLICPNCDEDLMDLAECGFNCCPYCGQSIDWNS